MTTYILAGGADTKNNPGYWKDLRRVLDTKTPLHILSCQFSQPLEQWQERFESFKPYFLQGFGEDMTCELADPKTIAEQIKRADIIYLHGGDAEKLKKLLQSIDVENLFTGKIVIGSSAGSQFLGKTYWSCGPRELGEGRGLVDCYPVVHYDSDFGSDEPRGPIDWDAAVAQLQAAIGDNKVTKIREGQFVIFTVE